MPPLSIIPVDNAAVIINPAAVCISQLNVMKAWPAGGRPPAPEPKLSFPLMINIKRPRDAKVKPRPVLLLIFNDVALGY